MGELKYAITAVEIIIGVLVAMVLGDYLGYRIGRWRLAAILGGMLWSPSYCLSSMPPLLLPSDRPEQSRQ